MRQRDELPGKGRERRSDTGGQDVTDTTLRAIPTPYGGVKFRSRLEARWAMFFDRLHIPWEYEPQGFDIGDGEAYLPDFIVLLGDIVWTEVKPSVWADPDGVARWRKFMGLQKPGTRGVLLTSMNGRTDQEFLVLVTGEGEQHLPWSSCPAGYHFDLIRRGSREECRQCGEISTTAPPWDDDKRISEAYSAALSARFGTG